MMFDHLKREVCQANRALVERNLVSFTWGNVSAIDRAHGVVAIKPSGVAYDDLIPEMIVLVDLQGSRIEGDLRPSSDTPIHLELYRCFLTIGGICHTHSPAATAWAQAGREIPCLGTTHADSFHGPIPITEPLNSDEIEADYERHTGTSIARRFAAKDPLEIPAALVIHHGPFTWGRTAAEAIDNAATLEQVAQIALDTLRIRTGVNAIPESLLDKHFSRKHGKSAYYGQSRENHT